MQEMKSLLILYAGRLLGPICLQLGWGCNFPGSNFPGGIFPRGIFPRGIFPRTALRCFMIDNNYKLLITFQQVVY